MKKLWMILALAALLMALGASSLAEGDLTATAEAPKHGTLALDVTEGLSVGDMVTLTLSPDEGFVIGECAYAVEGVYAFTVAAGGDTPNGYKLQDWDGTKWTNARFVESLSYTYDAATSAPLVKLTWRKSHPFIFVVR